MACQPRHAGGLARALHAWAERPADLPWGRSAAGAEDVPPGDSDVQLSQRFSEVGVLYPINFNHIDIEALKLGFLQGHGCGQH